MPGGSHGHTTPDVTMYPQIDKILEQIYFNKTFCFWGLFKGGIL